MTIAYVCDRCGKVDTNLNSKHIVQIEQDNMMRALTTSTYHLCPDCKKDFDNFMNNCAVVSREESDGKTT